MARRLAKLRLMVLVRLDLAIQELIREVLLDVLRAHIFEAHDLLLLVHGVVGPDIHVLRKLLLPLGDGLD